MSTPFEPLQYLEYELSLDVCLSLENQITAKGMCSLHPHQKHKAHAVLKTYNKLLKLQLNAPSRKMRPSVRKLLAQGKIEIKGGQYVKRGDLLQN